MRRVSVVVLSGPVSTPRWESRHGVNSNRASERGANLLCRVEGYAFHGALVPAETLQDDGGVGRTPRSVAQTVLFAGPWKTHQNGARASHSPHVHFPVVATGHHDARGLASYPQAVHIARVGNKLL